jgi:hypothetical protein
MLTLPPARPATARTPEAADQAELSRTLVPLVDPIAAAWPSHARRCLNRLPERLRWATPLLDPDHPGPVNCTPEQARDLLLWLHHLPSYEHLIVGCHRRRPA